ncbi:MAG: histidine kinase, partial [Candidatus Marinimicrobia bacterium CG_4_9_14_3_um_filter_48_9]
MKTEFASPERLNKSDLAVQTEAIKRDSVLGQMLDAMPNIILVLNRQRQVVFANQVLLDHFNITSIDEFVGLRPGEILNCIHSAENEAGCGTTEFCRECGAANAILNSQKNGADIQECRIIQNESLEALDLRINATRFKVSEEEFTIFAVTDISNEKRREVLEQLFFHDVLNAANGMIGYTELLRIVDQDQVPGVADQLMTMHDR